MKGTGRIDECKGCYTGAIFYKVIFIDGKGKLVTENYRKKENAEATLEHLIKNYSIKSFYD